MTKLNLSILLVVVVVLISGCAPDSRSLQQPISSKSEESARPARAFLAKNESPHEGLGAYGYVLLTRRPRPEEKGRYTHFCEAYIRSLEPATSYREVPNEALMVTHWFLTSASSGTGNLKCETLVDLYDFARATPIATSTKTLDSPGPVLAAWATSYKQDVPTSTALTLDLSRFADEDFDRALSIWKAKIVDDPSTWNDGGFKLTKIREALRNLIQQYGDQIVKIVKSPTSTKQE